MCNEQSKNLSTQSKKDRTNDQVVWKKIWKSLIQDGSFLSLTFYKVIPFLSIKFDQKKLKYFLYIEVPTQIGILFRP